MPESRTGDAGGVKRRGRCPRPGKCRCFSHHRGAIRFALVCHCWVGAVQADGASKRGWVQRGACANPRGSTPVRLLTPPFTISQVVPVNFWCLVEKQPGSPQFPEPDAMIPEQDRAACLQLLTASKVFLPTSTPTTPSLCQPGAMPPPQSRLGPVPH